MSIFDIPGQFWGDVKALFGPGGIAPGAPPALKPTRHGQSFSPGNNIQVPPNSFGGAGKDIQAVGSAAEATANAVTDVTDFLKLASWLVNPFNWLRMVEFLVGLFLMYLGMRSSFNTFRSATVQPSPAVSRALRAAPVIGTMEARRQGRRQAQRTVARERKSKQLRES